LLPVALVDERLTGDRGRSLRQPVGRSGASGPRAPDRRAAATLILRTYLEQPRRAHDPPDRELCARRARARERHRDAVIDAPLQPRAGGAGVLLGEARREPARDRDAARRTQDRRDGARDQLVDGTRGKAEQLHAGRLAVARARQPRSSTSSRRAGSRPGRS
jgi:hypothetical protein